MSKKKSHTVELEVELEPELKNRLIAIAKKMNKTASQLASELITEEVKRYKKEKEEYNKWFLEQVDIGLKDIEINPTIPHEEVMKGLKDIIEKKIEEKKLSQPKKLMFGIIASIK